MSSPLAKVVRYINDGSGPIGSDDVQGAIDELGVLIAGVSGGFADHAPRHEAGGADQIDVTGLSGLLADSQTPTSHAASHESGGSDAIASLPTSDQKAAMDASNAPDTSNPFLTSNDAATPISHAASHQLGGSDEINVNGLSGVLADSQTPSLHASSHESGGSDEINVNGLSGVLADSQTPISHAASHQLGGSDQINVNGLSGVLADAQTPTSHAASHKIGGSDEIDTIPTDDEKAAMAHPIASPSGANYFLTLNDLPFTQDQVDAITSANSADAFNRFATINEVSGSQLTQQQVSAINNANNPGSSNPFVTFQDLASGGLPTFGSFNIFPTANHHDELNVSSNVQLPDGSDSYLVTLDGPISDDVIISLPLNPSDGAIFVIHDINNVVESQSFQYEVHYDGEPLLSMQEDGERAVAIYNDSLDIWEPATQQYPGYSPSNTGIAYRSQNGGTIDLYPGTVILKQSGPDDITVNASPGTTFESAGPLVGGTSFVMSSPGMSLTLHLDGSVWRLL